MIDAHGKIKILLVDDNPSFLSLEPKIGEQRHKLPRIHDQGRKGSSRADLSANFDLRWVATACEAREFRDLSLALAARSPAHLGLNGWVPEIICFDYALTGRIRAVDERDYPPEIVEALSPLPALRRAAASLKLKVPTPSPEPDTGAAHDADNHGCFAGGMIFSAFSDHPCAPVALTRKGSEKTIGTEAAFFEWMLEQESNKTFSRKGRPAPTWNELIFDGVDSLMKRLEQLAKSGIVQISLDDLIALADEKAQSMQQVLTVRSRYGRWRLPTQGLFINFAESERKGKAQQWAKKLLEDTIRGFHQVGAGEEEQPESLLDLWRGRKLAEETLWYEYCSPDRKDRREKRLLLSSTARLLLDGDLESLSDQAIAAADEFGVNLASFVKFELNKALREKDSLEAAPVEIRKKIKEIAETIDSETDEKQKTKPRKAMDRLEKKLQHLPEDIARQSEKIGTLEAQLKRIASCTFAGTGESECECNYCDIRHPDYTSRQQRWAALMVILRVVHFRWAAAKAWQERFRRKPPNDLLREVDRDDIYSALFPLATKPLVLFHDQNSGDPESDWKTLIRLSQSATKTAYGDICLSVSDILNGRDWIDDQKAPTKNGTHGFLTGERLIMTWYAEWLYGCDKGDWRTDDGAKKILLGENHANA